MFCHRLSRIGRFSHSARYFFTRQMLAKVLSLLIIGSLLANTTPAAPTMVLASLNQFGREVRYAYLTNPTLASLGEINLTDNFIFAFFFKSNVKQQTIARIEVSPNRPTIREGEKIAFAAIATDARGNVIQGVPFNWTAVDIEKKSPMLNLKNGEFEAAFADQFVITAEAGGVIGQTLMIVQKDTGLLAAKELTRMRTEEAIGIRSERALRNDVAEELNKPVPPPVNVSTRDRLDEKTIRERQERIRNESGPPANSPQVEDEQVSDVEKSETTESIKTKGGPSVETVESDKTDGNLTAPVMQSGCSAVNYNATGSWNSSNYTTSDDPGLHTGNPPNTGTDGVGSGNFSFSAPVFSFGERGDSDISLALTYNSLLWHQANGQITFDIDKDYPAPGWSIGLGKIMDTGGSSPPILVSADGTRHATTGTIVTMTSTTSYFYGHTTDGSMIDYVSYRNTTTGITTGQSWNSNGTVIDYGAASNGVAYPTKMTDRHGNQTTITYCNNIGPNINTITDNLGRVIQFNYDSLGRLINITGPGFNNTTRTFVRLHYQSFNLTGTFSGLSPQVRNSTPYVIDAIYYPGTNTGYWFGDSDSYSSYGMIAKVVEQRGMSSTGTSTDQGTVTQGVTTRQMVYNYPLAPSNLTKAPEYTQMTEDWAGRETNTPVATTNYSINNNSSPRITTTTLPNGNQIKQSSYNNPGQWNDGLLYQVETIAPGNVTLSKSVTSWEQGAYDTVRVTEIQNTDEKNQTTKQSFTYDNYYNQVATISEYGYGSGSSFPLYRKKVITYENSTDYRGNFNNGTYPSGRHIFSLVKTEELFDATVTPNVRLSKTSYTYDGATLVAAPNVPMFDPKNDPYTTQMYNTGVCLQWNYPPYGSPYCSQWQILPVFQSATLKRGNVTNVTSYADAINQTGVISYDSTYDITGNVRTATTDCCELMSFYYSNSTKYSQPESHTKGSPTNSALQNVESATYDFNTGAMLSSTDFNGLVTNYSYDALTRPIQTTLPTGGKSITEYDDLNLKLTQTATLSASQSNLIVSQGRRYLNGRGQTIKSEALAGNGWNASQVRYDLMGRQIEASLPYDATGSPTQWTKYTYDVFSRVIQVEAPDGSISQTVYNDNNKPSSAASNVGNTVRSVDAWGRERWARTDDFGRLVEVVEPDPNGNGSVLATNNMVTRYTYSPKDELIQVNQGDQVRKFAYDSLGRLVRQKLAEQANTIEGLWSDKFVYDNRSNLIERTDARGVKTNFVYNNDPLNRLQSVNYDKTQAANPSSIADAPSVTMGYMTSGDKTRVSTVTTTGISSETNSYDSFGRVQFYSISMFGKSNMTMEYQYDTANRLTSVTYPSAFNTPLQPKVITPSYDNASRLKEVLVNGQTQMSDIVYNPMSQVTSLRTGAYTNNADIEQYSYDAQTGLLTGQQVIKQNSSQQLLNLSYNYQRFDSNGNPVAGKTGQLTKITDNLNQNRNRIFEFDTLGRLKTAKGGQAAGGVQTPGTPAVTANWTQSYEFDRYGNRTNVAKTGNTETGKPALPLDGLPNLNYDTQTNRIVNTNYEYDSAGNQTRGQAPNGTFQRFDYDAAGRLVVVRDDAGTPIESYSYGASRQRLRTIQGSLTTYYAWGGSSVLCEYTETTNNSGTFKFSKSYIYTGSRLLSTQVWNGSSETTEFHHPDRLGTRLVTNDTAGTHYEQSTLPFGTALNAESSGFSNQVFTSYDRSNVAQLDYAVNRSYSSGQGRFTTVDPIGMRATNLAMPQSLNLYAYVVNNPISFTDPSGLDALDDFVQGYNAAFAALDSPLCSNFLKSNGGFGGRDPKEVLTAYISQQLLTYGNSRDFTTPGPNNTTNTDSITFSSGNTGAKTLTSTALPINFDDGTSLTGNPILINERGFFFSLRTYEKDSFIMKPNSYVTSASEFSGLSNADVRGAVIIHELAHAFGAILPDGGNDALSKSNSETIKEKCFSNKAKLLAKIFKRQRNAQVTTTPGQIDNNITLRPGGGGGGGSFSGYRGGGGGDPFRSLNWLLFEQWVRNSTTYSVSVRVKSIG